MKFLISIINVIILYILIFNSLKLLKIAKGINRKEILFNKEQYSTTLFLRKIFLFFEMLWAIVIILISLTSAMPLNASYHMTLILIILIGFIKLNSYTKYIILPSSIIYLYKLKEYKFTDVKDIQIIPTSSNKVRIKFLLEKGHFDAFFKLKDSLKLKNFLENNVLSRDLSLDENNLLFPN